MNSSATTNTHIVIMAGGIGSRFWPMSVPQYPKQFIDVLGVGKSLIQMTMDRFASICPKSNFWVVTSEKYVDIVKEQLPDIPDEHILAEPAARNTAPCIAYACWKIKKMVPDANVVVTPSDAVVMDTVEFQRVIGEALRFTSGADRIVTIGIKPSRPETGYGYIKAETEAVNGIFKVEAFKEKPCREVAEEYIRDASYSWNAGIFVWNVDTIVKAITRFTPGLAHMMDEMAKSFYSDREQSVVGELFPNCEKVSIDYAVMEKAENIYTLPADFGWSDLGSWGALRTLVPQDERRNAVVGERVKLVDCEGCVEHVSEESQVVLQGLKNYIVAEKDGRLLVCQLAREQEIKEWQ